ncbi:hypothetical protein DFH09DRAFT_1101230 [Mycena vulgaris]|nr:hypothetical protein DFH09DRAFT_1101230 [Mycena vulgaris]
MTSNQDWTCYAGVNVAALWRCIQAIAQAVYARADLVLLDGVLSALDGETEAHVFAFWFGPDGMLKGKTTVLVAHGIHHLPSVNKVIIMDGGTITHFGTFEEVRDAGATFALASTAGKAEAGAGQMLAKESATAATVVDEEQDQELNWAIEQASRRGAYAFYIKCTGAVRACGLFDLVAAWSSIGIFATAYLSMLASASGNHLELWVAGYGAVVASTLLFMALTLLYFGYTLSNFTAPHIHAAELSGVLGSPISWITKNPVRKILNRSFCLDLRVPDNTEALFKVLARHPSRRSGVSLRLHNSNRGVPNLADLIGSFVRGHRAGYPGFTQAKKGKKVRQDSITTAKLTHDTDTVSTSAVYHEPSHPDDIPDECELEEGECEEEYLGEVEEDNGFNMDASRERSG